MRKVFIAWVVAALLLSGNLRVEANDSQASTTSTTTTNNGTSTGQRIGNIISAVATTAFPAIKPILDAIWPNRGAKPNDTKKASDAETALNNAKTQSDANQKSNINDLQNAASNLAVARTFITNCGDVSVRISAMQSSLSAKPPDQKPTDADKQALHDIWDPAKKRLDALQTDAITKAIDGIKNDDFLKGRLQEIRDAATNVSDNVGKQIDQGRFDALRGSLSELAPKVDGVAPLAGILIGDLSSSLNTAANNLAGGAGSEEDPAADKDRSDNVKLLDRLYATRPRQ